jgi:ubiquinone/menaquinone biosynthesis C-methylase UbiE
MNPRAPAADFDRIARHYRWMERLTFGRSLERCRNHFLPRLADCRSALVLGDGDGRFLAGLLACNAPVRVDAVDSSAAMLRLLSERCSAAAHDAEMRLHTHHASALVFTPERSYDLIVTHFFLDCLTQTELDRLCARLGAHLEPGAMWLVSDFRIPEGAMRWPAQAVVRLLYLAFRVLTGLHTSALPDHAAALTSAGFARIAERHSLAGLLTSELWRRGEYTPAMLPEQRAPAIADPVPDPEPASPSLPEPDPGVYHPQHGAEHSEPAAEGRCDTQPSGR